MNLLLINVILALGWCAVNGEFTWLPWLIGFALVYGCFMVGASVCISLPDIHSFWAGLRLLLLFLTELVKSCIAVAKQVLMPKLTCSAGIVAIPLEVKTDLEITLLANLIHADSRNFVAACFTGSQHAVCPCHVRSRSGCLAAGY